MTEWDAIVVGAGPNGLTAAARLATNGRKVLVLESRPTIGGGCRTAELLEPGIRHDVCAAIHPSGAGSPAFEALRLVDHGLEWCHPPLALAHPLDGDEAAELDSSVDRTAASLGARDGDRYRRWVGPLLDHWDAVRDTAMRPIVRIPSAPISAARFALAGVPSASLAARRFRDEPAKALLAGLAAHSCVPLDRAFTTGVGLTLGLYAHTAGWPVARGGSQSIVDALARVVTSNGGVIETDRHVSSLTDLPNADHVLLDVTPRQLVAMAGGRLDGWAGRPYRRFQYGPSVVKLDYVMSGPMPWRAPAASRAGTVHLGGRFDEIAAGEAAMTRGEVAQHPFVLVAQPAVADPSRAVGGRQPLWVYCHLQRTADAHLAIERIESQLDRYAPGWRDLVVASTHRSAADLEAYNPSNVEGDIAGGSISARQLIARPRFRPDPYATPLPGVRLCGASTPPGAGVHGMAGWNAAGPLLR